MNIIELLERQLCNYDHPATRNVVAAVREILRNKMRRVPVETTAFKIFVEALSAITRSHPSDFGLLSTEMKKRPPRLSGFDLAYELERYLQCFVRVPQLENENPIGVCRLDSCGVLFLKNRTDQGFHSIKCKAEHWKREKLRVDPDYFANIAKEYRNRQPF